MFEIIFIFSIHNWTKIYWIPTIVLNEWALPTINRNIRQKWKGSEQSGKKEKERDWATFPFSVSSPLLLKGTAVPSEGPSSLPAGKYM